MTNDPADEAKADNTFNDIAGVANLAGLYFHSSADLPALR